MYGHSFHLYFFYLLNLSVFSQKQEARGVYLYFLAKISELLDTVFFVLRKKDRQISFLHLYHHTVMPMISWGATKYYPGGHGTFIGKIFFSNSIKSSYGHCYTQT